MTTRQADLTMITSVGAAAIVFLVACAAQASFILAVSLAFLAGFLAIGVWKLTCSLMQRDAERVIAREARLAGASEAGRRWTDVPVL
jgi:hypothetical protein